jgi:hypothetical protein
VSNLMNAILKMQPAQISEALGNTNEADINLNCPEYILLTGLGIDIRPLVQTNFSPLVLFLIRAKQVGNMPADVTSGVKSLLQKGADPNKSNTLIAGQTGGWQPLIWSIKLGFDEVTKTLIHYGASVDTPYFKQETPLSLWIELVLKAIDDHQDLKIHEMNVLIYFLGDKSQLHEHQSTVIKNAPGFDLLRQRFEILNKMLSNAELETIGALAKTQSYQDVPVFQFCAQLLQEKKRNQLQAQVQGYSANTQYTSSPVRTARYSMTPVVVSEPNSTFYRILKAKMLKEYKDAHLSVEAEGKNAITQVATEVTDAAKEIDHPIVQAAATLGAITTEKLEAYQLKKAKQICALAEDEAQLAQIATLVALDYDQKYESQNETRSDSVLQQIASNLVRRMYDGIVELPYESSIPIEARAHHLKWIAGLDPSLYSLGTRISNYFSSCATDDLKNQEVVYVKEDKTDEEGHRIFYVPEKLSRFDLDGCDKKLSLPVYYKRKKVNLVGDDEPPKSYRRVDDQTEMTAYYAYRMTDSIVRYMLKWLTVGESQNIRAKFNDKKFAELKLELYQWLKSHPVVLDLGKQRHVVSLREKICSEIADKLLTVPGLIVNKPETELTLHQKFQRAIKRGRTLAFFSLDLDRLRVSLDPYCGDLLKAVSRSFGLVDVQNAPTTIEQMLESLQDTAETIREIVEAYVPAVNITKAVLQKTQDKPHSVTLHKALFDMGDLHQLLLKNHFDEASKLTALFEMVTRKHTFFSDELSRMRGTISEKLQQTYLKQYQSIAAGLHFLGTVTGLLKTLPAAQLFLVKLMSGKDSTELGISQIIISCNEFLEKLTPVIEAYLLPNAIDQRIHDEIVKEQPDENVGQSLMALQSPDEKRFMGLLFDVQYQSEVQYIFEDNSLFIGVASQIFTLVQTQNFATLPALLTQYSSLFAKAQGASVLHQQPGEALSCLQFDCRKLLGQKLSCLQAQRRDVAEKRDKIAEELRPLSHPLLGKLHLKTHEETAQQSTTAVALGSRRPASFVQPGFAERFSDAIRQRAATLVSDADTLKDELMILDDRIRLLEKLNSHLNQLSLLPKPDQAWQAHIMQLVVWAGADQQLKLAASHAIEAFERSQLATQPQAAPQNQRALNAATVTFRDELQGVFGSQPQVLNQLNSQGNTRRPARSPRADDTRTKAFDETTAKAQQYARLFHRQHLQHLDSEHDMVKEDRRAGAPVAPANALYC